MIMRVPAGRPHFKQSLNPRGTQELKLLIENVLITPQVKLTSDEPNCKSGCNSKDKWTNGIMEYSIFNCTVGGGGGGLTPKNPNQKWNFEVKLGFFGFLEKGVESTFSTFLII